MEAWGSRSPHAEKTESKGEEKLAVTPQNTHALVFAPSVDNVVFLTPVKTADEMCQIIRHQTNDFVRAVFQRRNDFVNSVNHNKIIFG